MTDSLRVQTPDLEPFEESQGRVLRGWPRLIATALAIGLSLYSLYWVLFIVQPQVYRVSFLLVSLVLVFLLLPARRSRATAGVAAFDWVLIGASVVALSWPILDFSRFIYRAADPLPIDVVLGGVTILLVLEATRRSVGWILPATAISFIAYGWAGPYLRSYRAVAHRASRLRVRSTRGHAVHDA